MALQKLQQSGCVMTTAQSMVFELMRSADHPDFKTISNIIKVTGPEEFKEQTSL